MRVFEKVYRIITLFVLLTLLVFLLNNTMNKWVMIYGCFVVIFTSAYIVTDLMSKHILFCKTRPNATIPTRKIGNAGFDIYGVLPEDNQKGYEVVEPHSTIMLPTGIKSVIPENYYIQIQERGSTGHKGIKYSAGVIDSNYRGEWFLGITNTNDKPVVFYKDLRMEGRVLNEVIDMYDALDSVYGVNNYILYPLSKAIFQGVLHRTYDDITSKAIDNEKFEKYKTERGEGKLGSSGK